MSLEQFAIIESTLREGEQFANAFFDSEQKVEIAHLLDAFGVEYLELTSPAASPQSRADCTRIAGLGLRKTAHAYPLPSGRCTLGRRYRR